MDKHNLVSVTLSKVTGGSEALFSSLSRSALRKVTKDYVSKMVDVHSFDLVYSSHTKYREYYISLIYMEKSK